MMSLPGYSRARMALISSGCGIGVPVGIGVDVCVRVGVQAGSGVAVDVGATMGVVNEAAGLTPHEEMMKHKLTINDQ